MVKDQPVEQFTILVVNDFVAFYTWLFTPRGAKKHAGQNTDYLAGLLRAWWKLD